MAIIDKIQLSGTVYTIGQETTTAVTSASTDNEIPTAKAVYDAIPTGGTGGGKAISAGTNISVTTGETADTVSCTLPITNRSNALSFFSNSTVIGNSQSVNFGYSNSFGTYPTRIFNFGDNNSTPMYGNYYYVNFGDHNSLEGYGWDYVFGTYLKVTNQNETAFGKYNKSNTDTLFSIGNGTGSSTSARHNAFEIRQNGDIYITSGGTDIKLQDNLGGGGASYSAGTGIDITNDVISVSGVVMSSAVTSAVTSGSTDVVTSGGVYDQLGGMKIVKLTQSAYDALTTKDASTIYFIVN